MERAKKGKARGKRTEIANLKGQLAASRVEADGASTENEKLRKDQEEADWNASPHYLA